MNKTAIKNFAIWARVQLIEAVKQKAFEYEVGEEDNKIDLQVIGGRLLSDTEREQRNELIRQIKRLGFHQVMEEAAYTWFNRFIALRYMEVKNYLPSKTRIFSDENNAFKPQVLKEAMTVEIDGLDRAYVLDLLDKQDNETLYKYLIITQCNALNALLPEMFEKISNWTELLFPNNLLSAGSVLDRLVTDIDVADWEEQVQIIGWLYQFYNSELKDETYAALKKKVKLTKEKIPAVTQLFTPDWIVRYMVENSLGRLWYEGHPDEAMKSEWKYYLEEAEQETEVQAQLDAIRAEYANIKPEEIKIIDPSMGSGHVLVYAFDVLMQIYRSQGWSERDAAKSIVENNLYGIDIDKRAYQLAYFAVMMKARFYSRRILTQDVKCNLCAIEQSNELNYEYLSLFGDLKATATAVADEMRDAKEYGSILIIKTPLEDLLKLKAALEVIENTAYDNFFDSVKQSGVITDFKPLLKQAILLAQKYDAVITNPPYMSPTPKQKPYVEKNYPDSKSDLFAVFIEKCQSITNNNRFYAMITMQSWMFLSSFEKLRIKMMQCDTVNMAHLGARGFDEIAGEIVQTTAFVKRLTSKKSRGVYCRLVDASGENEKEKLFLSKQKRYFSSQNRYNSIPGAPVIYWVGKSYIDAFNNGVPLSKLATPKQGMSTCDVDRFTKRWYEISILESNLVDVNNKKWVKYNKGGSYRRWYGNRDYLVLWNYNGELLRKNNAALRNQDAYFSDFIAWSKLSAGGGGFRQFEENCLFDGAGGSLFVNSISKKYLLGFLNSKVTDAILNIISPTVNCNESHVGELPVIIDYDKQVVIEQLVSNNILISVNDWDSFETSWDFERHPLVAMRDSLWDATAIGASMHYYYGENPPRPSSPLELCYLLWQGQCNERFNQLKANEEELNRIFIDIYGLQDELTPNVEDKDVTVRKADLQRDIKSLISYAVGCMFGRYSLEKEGLVFAGGNFDDVYWKYHGQAALDKNENPIGGGYAGISTSKYHYPTLRDRENWESTTRLTIEPDFENIIPITDDEYFDDDIVGYFVDFIRKVYGEDTLEENLKFIADALGGTGTPREVIRKYFISDFYKDHLKVYQKRPIYWLFDSGKKNGFKALIYMHRYTPDLLARMRTDYIHEQQERYRTQIALTEEQLLTAAASEKVKLNKKLAKLKDQALEVQVYEEKIHHLADMMIDIDLDDGVKVNYAKFGDLLAKI